MAQESRDSNMKKADDEHPLERDNEILLIVNHKVQDQDEVC